jgi:hypothetical protein
MERTPNPDMEIKKKLIALAALPLSVGFLVWRLQSNTQAAPPPQPPAVTTIVEAPAPEVSPMTAAGVRQVVAVPVSTRDPFVPQMKTTVDRGSSEATAAPAPASNIPSTPSPNLPPLPALTVEGGGLHAFAPPEMQLPPLMPSEPSAPAEPAEPAKPVVPYHLSGVLKGSPDLAILRHSDGTRHLVRLGDMIDEDYRLVMVTENSARLSSKDKNHTLYVGGETAPVTKMIHGGGGLQARLAAAAVAFKH